MSKLGKKPMIIPKDTKVKFENGKLIFTGPKGSRELTLNDKIFTTKIDDKSLILSLIKKNETSKVLWGTTRSTINSALIGVSSGFEKVLLLTGVGFRASIKENIYSSKNITNCFDKFNGTDISQVKRNGMVLSVMRKIN